jgi:hypothetical protein
MSPWSRSAPTRVGPAAAREAERVEVNAFALILARTVRFAASAGLRRAAKPCIH